MRRNGHLNRSHAGCFWALKMEFPVFPDFGLCTGRADSQAHRGRCRGFFAKFLAAIFPGN